MDADTGALSPGFSSLRSSHVVGRMLWTFKGGGLSILGQFIEESDFEELLERGVCGWSTWFCWKQLLAMNGSVSLSLWSCSTIFDGFVEVVSGPPDVWRGR